MPDMSLLYYDFNGSSTSIRKQSRQESKEKDGATLSLLQKQKLSDFVIKEEVELDPEREIYHSKS